MAPPPYELRDKETGLVVPNFDNMDAEPGKFIEVYKGDAEGSPNARISGGALVRPGADPPPDPGPDPIPPDPPISGDAMDYPKTESELLAVLRSYATNRMVGMLDPRTRITTSQPIVISQTNNDGTPWGVNGNYAKITYKGPAGQPLLRFEGAQGVNNRGLTIKNLVLDGGDVASMSGSGASACLHLYAPLGDNGPIYKFHIESVYTFGAVNGIFLQGGVYEGMMLNAHAENHTGDGIRLEHMMNPVPAGGKNPIVSNVKLFGINSSRNFGAGLRSVFSVAIVGGSYVLNGGGGVVAPDGLRWAIMQNGENTGGEDQAVMVVPTNGYGSFMSMIEASGDGQTVCRRWDGTKWVNIGKPLIYNAAIGAGVSADKLGHGYYGPAPDPMKPIKNL